VLVVARAIFERRKPKKACCCAATRTRARPRTRPKPNTSAHACRHSPWLAPNSPHFHAPLGFFINGFFIVVQGGEKKGILRRATAQVRGEEAAGARRGGSRRSRGGGAKVVFKTFDFPLCYCAALRGCLRHHCIASVKSFFKPQ